MTPDLGIEPGPPQWKASALTTTPSLHPKYHYKSCYYYTYYHPIQLVHQSNFLEY